MAKQERKRIAEKKEATIIDDDKFTVYPKPKRSLWGTFLLVSAILLLGAGIAYQQMEIMALQQKQLHTEVELQQTAKQMKKVYVYDLEETLRSVKLDEMNREFEAKINILNDEVSTAQEKISSLKETKDKDNFSEMYLKSLKLKRDTMIQEYNRALDNLTKDVNRTVAEIAGEKNAAIIFDKRFISSVTENVEDVTPEVIKRITLERPKILDE